MRRVFCSPAVRLDYQLGLGQCVALAYRFSADACHVMHRVSTPVNHLARTAAEPFRAPVRRNAK